MSSEDIYSYIEENIDRYVALLERLCLVPPVPSGGLALLAPIIEEAIRCGMHTTLYPAGKGLPLLYAAISPPAESVAPTQINGRLNGTTLESLGFERALAVVGEKPTLLLYHECDLESPAPPKLDEGLVAAAFADRASLAARLAAIDAITNVRGGLPVQIKLLVDASGVAESADAPGEPALVSFVERYADGLAADACLWDVGKLGLLGGRTYAGEPVVYCGVKGRLAVELAAEGANQDAPAALATSVPNPAWRLIWALNSIKNDSEEILIDGFYDDMNPPSSEQNKVLRQWIKQNAAAVQASDEATLKKLGISSYLLGLSGFQLRLTDYYSPSISVTTLEVEGSGIPCRAQARIEFGLVPDQTPSAILAALREHLSSGNFADITVRPRGVALRPATTDLSHPFTALVTKVTAEAYGEAATAIPVAPISGPISPLVEKLALPAIGIGIGPQPLLRRSAASVPLSRSDFVAAIKQVAGIMDEVGKLGSAASWGAQARQKLVNSSGSVWQEVKIAAIPVTPTAIDMDNIEGMPDFSDEEIRAVMGGDDSAPAARVPAAPDRQPRATAITQTISIPAPPPTPAASNGSHAVEAVDEAVAALIAASGEQPKPAPRRGGRKTGPLNSE